MFTRLLSALVSIRSWFRTRAALQLENLALRHQLAVLKRSHRGRLRLDSADRLFWVWLSRFWSNWRSVLLLGSPKPVLLGSEEGSVGFGDGRVGKASQEGRRSTWTFGN